MEYAYRKVKNPTESEIRTLLAHGWEYVGEMKGKDTKGNRTKSTGIHRFRRPVVVTSSDDVRLSPKDVQAKIRAVLSAGN